MLNRTKNTTVSSRGPAALPKHSSTSTSRLPRAKVPVRDLCSWPGFHDKTRRSCGNTIVQRSRCSQGRLSFRVSSTMTGSRLTRGAWLAVLLGGLCCVGLRWGAAKPAQPARKRAGRAARRSGSGTIFVAKTKEGTRIQHAPPETV